ncbi:hypothetical protein O6H91_12G056000 [Diphasiastrum complanatum]|uniref:Uncharacterized protein n=1 Tax=Diphasiastrum complanatum TaxID=34168 RepID=A0ACC2C256_DIPCM|nr:hypothetical protein O6H91_12G056000 [Diphasiastrum complanatum]
MAYSGSIMQTGQYGREPQSMASMGYFPRPLDSSPLLNRYEGGLTADGLYNTQRRINSNGVSRFAEQLVEPVQQIALAHPQSPAKELVPVIEAAEFALRNQMEENDLLQHALRGLQRELQHRVLENEHLREIQNGPLEQQLATLQIEERFSERPSPVDRSQAADHLQRADGSGHLQSSRSSSANKDSHLPNVHSNSSQGYQSNLLPLPERVPRVQQGNGMTDPYRNQRHVQLPNQPHVDSGSISHLSSPSSRSTSPNRGHRGADMDPKLQLDGQGLAQHIPNASNYTSYQQQEIMLRTSRMLEEESLHLRNRLVDASIKEAQMLREMHALKRHLAELRMAYDQQQQGLADAASKALSYRHDVLEENVRLHYALQVAEQEKAVYVSSLLPLLAEFELQPTIPDAHSIVGAVKVLVQHLRAKFNPNENLQIKVREPRYYGQPWQPYYNQVTSPYIPHTGISQPPPSSNGHGLEIVSQQPYSVLQRPASPSSPPNVSAPNWGSSGIGSHLGVENEHAQQVAYDRQALPLQVSSSVPNYSTEQQEPRAIVSRVGESDGIPKSSENLSDSEADEAVNQVNMHDPGQERVEQAVRSPHLPPLLEEPINSISEDDDPLPAVDGLRIVGEAILGGKLTACGLSINGTSVCIFQWVRYYHDGSSVTIDGAAQPVYTITADDCDTIIAIHCVPMDERERKGELVKVYANDQNYIRCDSMMQDEIDSYITNGHVSFEVHLVVEGSSEDPATLTLKRSSYELRRTTSARRAVVVSEKYSPDVDVRIPVGHYYQCAITSSDSKVHYLDLRDNRIRDVVVLTMRHFLKAAFDRRKAKRTLPWLSKMVH